MSMKQCATIAFLAWLTISAHDAQAFYNPQTGRWLNRDPINELGFKVLTSRTIVFATNEEKNLYCFVGNTPIQTVDYLGLVGKVCIEKCCSAKALENIRYIPENIPAGVPCYLAWPLKPGQCYDADALYMPGVAIKVNGAGTITIKCNANGTYKDWGATPFTTTVWNAGTPRPPASRNGWPCGGDANPRFPPYTTNPPEQD